MIFYSLNIIDQEITSMFLVTSCEYRLSSYFSGAFYHTHTAIMIGAFMALFFMRKTIFNSLGTNFM